MADYELFKTMMEPLDKADIPWYPMMGNHDDRDAFFFFNESPDERARAMVRLPATARGAFARLRLLEDVACSDRTDDGAVALERPVDPAAATNGAVLRVPVRAPDGRPLRLSAFRLDLR